MKSLFRTLLASLPRTPMAMRTLPRAAMPPVPPVPPVAQVLKDAFGLGRHWRPGAATATRATDDATPVSSSPAAFTEGSFTAAGLSRRFKLYVPSTSRSAPALVVMLHGCTQDADDFAAGTRMNMLAERHGFLVLYPIQSRAANPASCWNWFRDQDQHRDGGEAAFIAALASHVATERHVDPDAVFVAGLSAGAAMAAILGREYPDVFAAVGLHSGLAAGSAHNVPDAMRAMQSGWQASRAKPRSPHPPSPAIVFQGDRDQTVHPTNADHVVASLLPAHTARPSIVEVDGATDRPSTKATYVDAEGRVLVERWTIHGAGHAWSGGDRRGTYADPAGVDASAEMIRFFAQHARRAADA